MTDYEKREFYLESKKIFYFVALLGQMALCSCLSPLLIILSVMLVIAKGVNYLHVITIASGLLMWWLDTRELANLIKKNKGEEVPSLTKYTFWINIVMMFSFVLSLLR